MERKSQGRMSLTNIFLSYLHGKLVWRITPGTLCYAKKYQMPLDLWTYGFMNISTYNSYKTKCPRKTTTPNQCF